MSVWAHESTGRWLGQEMDSDNGPSVGPLLTHTAQFVLELCSANTLRSVEKLNLSLGDLQWQFLKHSLNSQI